MRPTPETGVVRIEAKVSEAPLGGGHTLPPRIPIGGRPHQRGVKVHDTTAAVLRHSKRSGLLPKCYSIFTRLLRDLYDFPRLIRHSLQRQAGHCLRERKTL